MFLLRATYNRPIEEVDQLLEGHKAWIMKNFDEGRILLTARQVPLVGGIDGRALFESLGRAA